MNIISNEWFDTFNIIPDLIAILDNNNKIVRANKAMLEKMGITEQEIIGIPCYEYIHNMNMPHSSCPFAMMKKDGKEHTSEVHEIKFGADYLVSVTPIKDRDGNIIGALHIARDITERKKKETELYKLNRTLKAISDSNQSMMRAKNEQEYLEQICKIVIKDCAHKMVWIGFAEYDENKSVRIVAHAGFDEGYLNLLNITWADTERGRGPTGETIRTGKPSMCKDMLTDLKFAPWRDEAVKRGYASSISLPLIDNEGAFGALTIYAKETDAFSDDEVRLLSELADDLSYGIIAFRLREDRDKAEQKLKEQAEMLKAAEEVLKRDNESLEQLIKERSQKLIDTKLELERSKRLSDIGALATTVAHELRNPLAAINISSAIIKRKTNDETIMHHLASIEKCIAESDQIINNLLFYSRLRPPHIEPISIPDLIDECIYTVQKQSRKKVVLNRVFDISKDSRYKADPVQIKEIFNNILNNAFDAIAEETGRIEIMVKEDLGNAIISIEDNGHGIDSENIRKVFDPFFSTKAKGTGLGLSVCQNIINQHGGSISIESEVNKGTIVYITLPKK